jgi:hypothetical protein
LLPRAEGGGSGGSGSGSGSGSGGPVVRNRRIPGAMAAVICGSIAAPVLFASACGAHADELSDLRANSELLQQRIDDINRVQAGSDNASGLSAGGLSHGPAAAGAIGGDFPRSFLIPGTDTSVSIGGSVGESLGWTEGRPATGR